MTVNNNTHGNNMYVHLLLTTVKCMIIKRAQNINQLIQAFSMQGFSRGSGRYITSTVVTESLETKLS